MLYSSPVVLVALLIVGTTWTPSVSADEHCAACRSLTAAATVAALTQTHGTHSVLVVRVDFEDLPGPPRSRSGEEITATSVHQLINGPVNGYYQKVSKGRHGLGIQSDSITEILRLPNPASSYANEPTLQAMQADAIQAAEAAGYAPWEHDRVMVLLGSLGDVPNNAVTFSGYAAIGGRTSWFQGQFSAGLVIHELGHNLGLGHASRWLVPEGSTDPLDPDGTRDEYGDPYDIMGPQFHETSHRNVFHVSAMRQLGWLPEDAVQVVSVDGRYRVYPYDLAEEETGRVLALELPLEDGRSYWFSHRAAYDLMRHGLHVARADPVTRSTTLLDMRPGASNYRDVGLKTGDTFQERVVGFDAVAHAAGGEGKDAWVEVDITFQPEVSLRKVDITVLETAGSVELVLERRRSSEGAVEVDWATAPDTAISGLDYAETGGTVTWADGEMGVRAISVPLVVDGAAEPVESFHVALTNVRGGVLRDDQAAIHIVEPGVQDPTFQTAEILGAIRDLESRPNGSLLLAGDFRQIGNHFARGVAQLLESGKVDPAFDLGSGADRVPVSRVVLDGEDTYFTGAFDRFDGQSALGVVRLKAGGGVDATFASQLSGPVTAMVAFPSGGWLVGGAFDAVAGHPSPGVVRLDASGAVDERWASHLPLGARVTALWMREDDVLVAGQILEGLDWGVVALDHEGQLVEEWGAVDGEGATVTGPLAITRLLESPEGAIFVVGNFARFAEHPARSLVRLSAEGTVDASYMAARGAGANGAIADLALGADGRLIVVGAFDWIDGQTRHGVARLREDGVLDDWDPAVRLREARPEWQRLHGTAVLLRANGTVCLALSDQFERESWLVRVASGIVDLPGVIEFASPSDTADPGDEIALPVRRQFGNHGTVAVRYQLAMENPNTAGPVAFPAGELLWADGETQTKFIHVHVPSSTNDRAILVQLTDVDGGAQLGAQHTARIVLREALPREAWVAQHFGETGPEPVFRANADADADGVSNLLEYALGRDPMNGEHDQGLGALPLAVLAQLGPTSEHCLELLVNLPQALPKDIRYEVLVNNGEAEGQLLAYRDGDTGRWMVFNPDSPAPQVFPGSAGRQWVRFQDIVPAAESSGRFMRLRVVLEDGS